MNAVRRSSARDVRVHPEKPVTTCTLCPVCGSEECLVLEELGTYCATMTAASVARKPERAGNRR